MKKRYLSWLTIDQKDADTLVDILSKKGKRVLRSAIYKNYSVKNASLVYNGIVLYASFGENAYKGICNGHLNLKQGASVDFSPFLADGDSSVEDVKESNEVVVPVDADAETAVVPEAA